MAPRAATTPRVSRTSHSRDVDFLLRRLEPPRPGGLGLLASNLFVTENPPSHAGSLAYRTEFDREYRYSAWPPGSHTLCRVLLGAQRLSMPDVIQAGRVKQKMLFRQLAPAGRGSTCGLRHPG